MACLQRQSFTRKAKNRNAEQDAKTNLILSRSTMNKYPLSYFFPRFGDMLPICREEAVFFRIWFVKFFFFSKTFNMELLWWASLTLVYAHNHHRRNVDNPVSVGSCMEREVRLMTAITPTYGHAYQSLCLVERPIAIPHQKFPLPAVKAECAHLTNSRQTTTRQKGNDFQGYV